MYEDQLVVPRALLEIMLGVIRNPKEVSCDEQIKILKDCLVDIIEESDTLEDWKKQWTTN